MHSIHCVAVTFSYDLQSSQDCYYVGKHVVRHVRSLQINECHGQHEPVDNSVTLVILEDLL